MVVLARPEHHIISMRTFLTDGTHHCYTCGRPFPDGDPVAAKDAKLEADIRALADDDEAARASYALAQRRAKEAAQTTLYLPRFGLALPDGVRLTVDGVSIVVPKPLPVERIPGIITHAVDETLLPMLREHAIQTLFAQVIPSSSPPKPSKVETSRLTALLGSYPSMTTRDMYPNGYTRQPDGSVHY